MADQGGVSSSLVREYRKGNWTLQETMVLIEAKKMDDERRMKRSIGDHQSGSEGRNKPTELRWKWVEDYCWRNGCFRSQNQCNDKWDNLMRDYKKVRDFERRIAEKGGQSNHIEGSSSSSSYWKLERNERKDKNLPSNMVPQIYEALVDVVERKGSSSSSSQPASTTPRPIIKGGDGCGSGGGALVLSPTSGGNVVAQPSLQQRHHMSVSVSPLPLLPPPTSTSVVLVPPSQPVLYSLQQPLPTTVDSDTSEHSDSPAKRRRRGRGEGTSGGGGGGNIGGTGLSTTAATTTTSTEVGTAISRSASIIAEAIQACEEREERRHRELLSVHERRLRMEEINRQGVNGLVDAITKLADSIRALASSSSSRSGQQTPPDDHQ